MAFSLEARVPYLALPVVRFVVSLSDRMKIRGAETKRLLRRALAGRGPGGDPRAAEARVRPPTRVVAPRSAPGTGVLAARPSRARALARPRCESRRRRCSRATCRERPTSAFRCSTCSRSDCFSSAMAPKRPKVVHLITRLELGGAQQNTLYCVEHHDRSRFAVGLWAGEGGRLDAQAKAIREADVRIVPWIVHPVAPVHDLAAVGPPGVDAQRTSICSTPTRRRRGSSGASRRVWRASPASFTRCTAGASTTRSRRMTRRAVCRGGARRRPSDGSPRLRVAGGSGPRARGGNRSRLAVPDRAERHRAVPVRENRGSARTLDARSGSHPTRSWWDRSRISSLKRARWTSSRRHASRGRKIPGFVSSSPATAR